MSPQQDLANLPLRDIHLPDTVSWWPPAPGWWLLGMLLLLGVFVFFMLMRRRKAKRLSVAVQARNEIARIRQGYEECGDKAELAKELSALLRRVCISIRPRQETASLTGSEWLDYLDKQIGSDHFVNGAGQVLIEAPYRHDVDYDPDVLLGIVNDWLGKTLASSGTSS